VNLGLPILFDAVFSLTTRSRKTLKKPVEETTYPRCGESTVKVIGDIR
jgi:hypothetical protein